VTTRSSKRAPYTPTDADLRAAHASERLLARIPFDQAIADVALRLAIRKLAEIRAHRVPAAPEHFELTA